MPVESDEGRHGQWLLNGYDLPHAATSEELLTWVEATMARVRLPHAHGPRLGPRSRDRLQHRHRHLHNDKGQYKQDQCRALARVTQSADSRAQSAERRAQRAERRAQSAERRAQSAGRGAQRPHKALQRQTYRSQSAMRPSPGEDRVRLAPMAHRRRDHVGEARKPKPDLRREVNMQGKEIAPSQCTQRGSASTHSTYLALAQEDSPRGQRGRKTIAGTGAATTIRERRQLISVATSQVERGEARSHLAERHARMYR